MFYTQNSPLFGFVLERVSESIKWILQDEHENEVESRGRTNGDKNDDEKKLKTKMEMKREMVKCFNRTHICIWF